MRLPNTDYLVYISALYWQTGFPDDERACVSPDVVVPVAAEDYFQGCDRAMEFILTGKARPLLQTFMEDGIEAGTKQYHQMLKVYGFPSWVPFSEREANSFGYQLLRGGDVQGAIKVFTLNTEAYPESWNVWDSLGEAHMKADNREEAIRSYRKSLELNPGNSGGRVALARLERGQ